jgi:hypothetical protein
MAGGFQQNVEVKETNFTNSLPTFQLPVYVEV